jgi:hypothetical protein
MNQNILRLSVSGYKKTCGSTTDLSDVMKDTLFSKKSQIYPSTNVVMYPFFLQFASTGSYSELNGIKRADFLLGRIAVFSVNLFRGFFYIEIRRFSKDHPHVSIFINVIQTCKFILVFLLCLFSGRIWSRTLFS